MEGIEWCSRRYSPVLEPTNKRIPRSGTGTLRTPFANSLTSICGCTGALKPAPKERVKSIERSVERCADHIAIVPDALHIVHWLIPAGIAVACTRVVAFVGFQR